ncbi:unnamed protein product [Darwinula stevensoni]|uniref:Serpin domain-containing protein n=1 Tax=Darwinula stevensoni TaxID=69355 RepID=A0A7R9AH79_9CRUS|nr:unnamed protein product [Darwinula stevensoni]CAG0905216.1 unnamed protein product [Darwinula stevensoni]
MKHNRTPSVRTVETIAAISSAIQQSPKKSICPMLSQTSVNAAYFKGQWLNPFEANETKNAAFILETSKRDIIPVPTMHQYDSYFPIGVSEELMASVIELPYAGGDGNELAMFIVLPKQTDNYTLDEMLQRLTPENLKEAKDLVFRKQVALLSLPKFKLQKEFNLVPVLSEMGLKSLFDPLQANFSCLTPILKTSLSSADHKAVIEVNEEGTEAAAATAFLAFRSGRLDPIELRISHPFFYFIYHHDTDSILFMGVVRNPLSD